MDVQPPYSSFLPRTRIARPDLLSVTKGQIEKQLVAVIELQKYNKAYLNAEEEAWVAAVINSATSAASDHVDLDSQPERLEQGRSSFIRLAHIRPNRDSRLQRVEEAELRNLLSTAKSLNAVMHLLSCCYERWSWSQSTRAIWPSRMSTDSQDFLSWTRKTGYSTNRTSSSISSPATVAQGQQSEQLDPHCAEDNLDEQLSSLVLDTVGRWRQDAEEALSTAAQTYQQRKPILRKAVASTTIGTPEGLPTCLSMTKVQGVQVPNVANLVNSTYALPQTDHSQIHREVGSQEVLPETVSPSSTRSEAQNPSLSSPESSLVRPDIPSHNSSIYTDMRHQWPYMTNLKNGYGKEVDPPNGRIESYSTPFSQRLSQGPSMMSLSSNATTMPYSLNNQSTISVQSHIPRSAHLHQSRGRKWLEQQFELDCRSGRSDQEWGSFSNSSRRS